MPVLTKKRQPAPVDTYAHMHMRNVAIVFWENLVSFYEGKPLSASINEKLCVKVFKDSAKKAAKEKK